MTEDVFLSSRQVRERYGNVSQMWLHRRLHDDSSFPKPTYIARQRYWKLSELVGWERVQAAKSAA